MDGSALLRNLADLLKRSVILPQWAAEAIALWILHTYAFHLRDITAYIGIESPEKRCGKTTLLTLLNELAHRAIASSNISPPAFFRVIEDLSPTLLIDEVDTFLSTPIYSYLQQECRTTSAAGVRPQIRSDLDFRFQLSAF